MSDASLLNSGFKYQNLLNTTTSGALNNFQLTTGAVQGYVLESDAFGNGSWVDLGTLGVSSIQGTQNQVLANNTYGSQQIGDIILTLPQSIGTSSNVQFGSATLGGLTLTGLTGVLKATAGLVSGSATTTDLPEGSPIVNQYFTTARARSALSGTAGISYSSSTGVIQLDSNYTPTFANIIDTGLTANRLVYSDSSKQLTSALLQGTTNQVTVSGLGTSTITLSLPQDIATTSGPQFRNLFIESSSSDTYFQLRNGVSGFNNFLVYRKDRTGGLNANEVIGQELRYGVNSSNALYTGMSCYTKNDSSTAGAEQASTIWQSMAAGSLVNIFGFVGSDVFLSNRTSNALTYVDSSKYIKSVGLGSSLSFSAPTLDTVQPITSSSSPTFAGLTLSGLTASRVVLSNASKALSSATLGSSLSLTGSTLDTVQSLTTSSSPTFSNVTLSSLPTSQYVKTNVSSALTTVSTIPASDVGFAYSTPITYTSNIIGLDYNTTNLTQTSFQLDTIQGISTAATPQFTGLSLLSSGRISDAALPLQLNATSTTERYLAVNKAGSYGALFGYSNNGTLGTTGLVIRNVANDADNIMFYTNNTTKAAVFDSSGNLNLQTHILYMKASDTQQYIKYQSSFDGIEYYSWQGHSFRTASTGSQEVMRVNTTSLNFPLQTASTYAYLDSSKNLVSRSSANFTSDVRSQISATSPLSYNSSTGVISASLPSTITSGTYAANVVSISGLNGVLTTNGEYTRLGNVVTYGMYFTCGHAAVATTSSISFTIDLPVNNSGGWPSSYSAHGSVSCSGNTGAARISNSQQFITTATTNLITFQVAFNVALVLDTSGFIGNILVTYYVT